jgi:hypothetical protein
MMINSNFKNIWLGILMIALSAGALFGQTSGFTYQGRLTDGGTPANGNYDLQFALYDAADGSNQIGLTKTVLGVPITSGVFTVTLDFGANAFSGANRFLEINARPTGAGPFTLLTPRQPITATPYALRSVNSGNADTATNAQQLAGVDASQYVKTGDARLSDSRDPKAGSSNYVQNSNNPQAATNFNISGNGTVSGALSGNIVNAATQYNLGGQKVLGIASDNGLEFGNNAHVRIGPVFAPTYQLDVEAPGKNGLRVGTISPGGTALSVGGAGDFAIDAPGTAGGRFVVKENGNVGIGAPNPTTSKLQVAGTVESTVNGFKFPDGSTQSTAANINPLIGKAYVNQSNAELEISRNSTVIEVINLPLPPGNYFITATVQFENRANDVFADNTRMVKCWFYDVAAGPGEFMGANHMAAPGNPMDWLLMTMHTTVAHNGGNAVALRCGNDGSGGKVFALNRRLIAVRMAD